MVRRSIHGLVVTDNNVAIGRRVDVEFDGGRTGAEGAFNGDERRGRSFEGSALVGKGNDSTFQPEIGHFAGSPFG
jgi:hypothetical protein